MATHKRALEKLPAAALSSIASPEMQMRFASRMARMPVSAIRELLKITEHPEIISFAGGLPAPELFPVEAIARAHAEVFANEGRTALQYSMTEGCRALREWIAARMHARGVPAPADRIMITSGAQQGIDLTAKVFLERGDLVVVENPTYLAAIQTFSGYEANFIAIEGDHDGMLVDRLEETLQHTRPKLIYVVSEFSNPKGTTLSYERRVKLIQLSARHGVPILEDNPYAELRYEGNRPPPLAALDTTGTVIHLGSFSKTLSPGMRLGWLTASEQVFQNTVIAKQASDLHCSTIEQRAAARLLQSFDYDGHVRHLCEVYGDRCLAMRNAIDRYFPAQVQSTRPEGGLFLWVELPERINAEEIFKEAIIERVAFVPGTPFFACEPKPNFMRLNFSNQNPETIEEGIKRIGKVLKRRLG